MTSPGQIWENTFPLFHPDTRAQSNADTLPTGVLIRNGVDTGETVTVTNEATGLYKAVVTVPTSYLNGDDLELKITATVGGKTDTVVIARTIVTLDAGAGAFAVTVTINDSGGSPLDGVDVVLTSSAGSPSAAIVNRGTTDVNGQFTFFVDEGTFYVWRQKSGVDFTSQPRTMTVSAAGTPSGNTITDGTVSAGAAPSSIDATTSISDLIAVYTENADYLETGDAAKAKLFAHACRVLILKFPKRSKAGGTETEIDPMTLREQLKQATAWIQQVSPPSTGLSKRGQTKWFDASNFRD